MSSVHDKAFYTLLRSYSIAVFLWLITKEYAGLERIPTDGEIFCAQPYQCVDGCFVGVEGELLPIVYVACRYFCKPLIAKLLNLLKIMLIVRIRGGVSNLKRNAEIMDVQEALRAGLHFASG